MSYNDEEDKDVEVDKSDVEDSQQNDQGLVDKGHQAEEDDPPTGPPRALHNAGRVGQLLTIHKPIVFILVDFVEVVVIHVVDGAHCDTGREERQKDKNLHVHM